MRFQNKQYVRWGDLDAFGHVNNATYLIYAQEARFAWSKMLEMVVARAEVDFIAPIYTGDIYIDVEITVNPEVCSWCAFATKHRVSNGFVCSSSRVCRHKRVTCNQCKCR